MRRFIWRHVSFKEKKEKILLSPMTKAPTPSEKSKSKRKHKDAIENFDYTTIADQIVRTLI